MKLCTLCRFFKFETDEGSSCETCGGSGYAIIGCGKGHWTVGLGDDRPDFYRGIRKAATCPDFSAYTDEEIATL